MTFGRNIASTFVIRKILLNSIAPSMNSTTEGTSTLVLASSADSAASTSRADGIVVISYPLESNGRHSPPAVRNLTLTAKPSLSSPAAPTAIFTSRSPREFIFSA